MEAVQMNWKNIRNPLCLRTDVRNGLQDMFGRYLTKDMVVYDVGCGQKPFSDYMDSHAKEYIGVDIPNGFYDSSHIDLVGDACHVPAKDGAADAVISSQVLEHLDRPIEAVREAARLLRQDGIFFLSFPFLYPIHAAPHDYLRYTTHYMEKLLRDEGFEIVEKRMTGGFWYCAGVFSGMYLKIFNCGILKRLMIVAAVSWALRSFFAVVHALEGTLLKIIRKDADSFRSMWAVNYAIVARKA